MTMTSGPTTRERNTAPAGSRRLLAAGRDADLGTHLRTFGSVALPESGRMLAELESSGLTGRGGAGFATWRKVAAAGRDRSPRRSRAPIVIGNGAEGEPLSWKDAVLLQNAPHLVIDGLLVAAHTVGARKIILYTGTDSLDALTRAIAERDDARRIELLEAADSFVSGEASAVVNAIEHDDPRPADRIVRMTDSGLKGRPTLLQNVETLAHVALIARYGGRWFRSVGAPDDPGTRLVTVSGDVAQQGVFEVTTDSTVDQVLRKSGTDPRTATAALIGGYHGAWVPSASFGAAFSPAGLAAVGAQPGAGIVHVLGRTRCGLDATAEITDYLAGQSARQCGPCMFGLPTMASRLSELAAGVSAAANAAELVRLSDLVVGRGACHHPDGTARLVRSALMVFAADVRAHGHGHCTRQEG
ncbi:NADH-ubiquinone oxidoreductase-F iron-sulfur binding region domain-containing protein [Leifsonia sp. 71-9]|uniref:NADH-ubiquinone oxidoreductase-F iron-sulfur binding region domain-containing protein n=1 Tax=Leifsonia sp. 71-9 TaxID=1895934 RepID=UPI0025B7F8E4|nr:NADH-ubiquinone oxidoreductase-F iron-sulfur binding region domain-containing protein [Leifsonia sp. 71-9]